MGIFSVLGQGSIAAFAQEVDEELDVDHAGMIREWGPESRARGAALYATLCITCHGDLTHPGSLPTSRPFWREPFKNGADPLSIFRTLGRGLGQMPAWTFLSAEQRYDVIHFIREEFVRPHQPSAYFVVTPEYLAGLPRGTGRGAKTEAMREFERGPKYLRMDFGPVLFWTLAVAPTNIAQKGIAVRLDAGPGGITRGRAWTVFDHDTLRLAAAWSGTNFVDWKGIAFDGSHGTHTSIVGEPSFVNPPGPGWANPATGSFDDPRPRRRDGLPYGPLPREWAHYQGAYLQGQEVVLAYTVGTTRVLDYSSMERIADAEFVTRTLEVAAGERELVLRVAPDRVPVALVGADGAVLRVRAGFQELTFPARDTMVRVKLLMPLAGSGTGRIDAAALARAATPARHLERLLTGGAPRWTPPIATRGRLGDESGPFAVDEITVPPDAANPWHTWMRFGGFDFYEDGRRAAIATWNGDVWEVDGLDGDLSQLTWRRLASGLFQPLGVRIVGGVVHVACRDQIARLRDLNGDGEIDLVENFNNDHQVTEHFHEFAMGLQTDAAGNFYYAKSARHALPALVPHHGTLLRVSADGASTHIVANGFRAANGVCVNPDGTFFVTDQEGHWTPKNRINRVRDGGFYGNMFGYHERSSSADADMEQPLVWITNDMDRSPGELVWVTSPGWGPLRGSLLNLSYGTGRIFLVPHETVRGHDQGGVVALPLPDSPTGTMRGRFHPGNGHLYTCGLYAWAGNRQSDGGFHRVRATGKPTYLPVGLYARERGVALRFTEALDPASAAVPTHYSVKIWSLKRSADYGSKHLEEKSLEVSKVTVSPDAKEVFLELPGIRPTWGMEIRCSLKGADGLPFERIVHNTIQALANGDER
ncbi:MAG: c-type cytochrome [Verrucomicrobiales bacterium]|nr:c-type cytochrome [Verrucomicrobiales bacterium]